MPSLSHARQKARCQVQLSNIFRGLSSYISDHDGRSPAVPTTPGAPWWKVGDQGKENHSNTRHMWLLVKGLYVEPGDFVCSGQRRRLLIRLKPSPLRNYNDFPDRGHVNFSFLIRCYKSEKISAPSQRVLMADLSPLFENLPNDYSNSFKLRLDDMLSTINSANHKRRGQNILTGDGRVEFVKGRNIGIAWDDIFTLQDIDVYQGLEAPSFETDTFLAP
jgi:hypothetical protein